MSFKSSQSRNCHQFWKTSIKSDLRKINEYNSKINRNNSHEDKLFVSHADWCLSLKFRAAINELSFPKFSFDGISNSIYSIVLL
jgi:hypothetical protein